MSIYNNNNKFVSYLIILASLFILFLFTKDKAQSIYEQLDLKGTYISSLNDNKAKLTELNNLKNKLVNSQEKIDKYNVVIKEDELIDYIYSSIDKTNGRGGMSTVTNITIWKSTETELWFKETLVNIALRVPSEEKMKQIINIFTSDTSKYHFFISSFNFPYWDDSGNYSLVLPLKILYK